MKSMDIKQLPDDPTALKAPLIEQAEQLQNNISYLIIKLFNSITKTRNFRTRINNSPRMQLNCAICESR